jgi:cellulose synthase/poly-beta-1,6-N-acetylglucosamine synthase-like glycosyltransferase
LSLPPPSVSILIPCKAIDKEVSRCLSHYTQLDYETYEIVLLPDVESPLKGVRVIATGQVTPGKKRNIGAANTKGEILAYIDADAYPRADWLRSAICHLQESSVGAVGGPGLTPPGADNFSLGQDTILSSFMVGGLSSRYRGKEETQTDDIHSVNFVAWRRVVEEVGGWNEKYWPGEDTLMCLGLKELGYKQVFAPDVVVYHQRRSTWKGYLQQIWSYGLHRGFFARKYPGNSRRPGYFIPSLLVILGALTFVLSPFSIGDRILLACSLTLYLALTLAVAFRDVSVATIALMGIPLTHLTYGLGFLSGLLRTELSR